MTKLHSTYHDQVLGTISQRNVPKSVLSCSLKMRTAGADVDSEHGGGRSVGYAKCMS